jgi:hypothetical protein
MDYSVDAVVSYLKLVGVSLTPGLTDRELGATEDRFGFEFCSDHRQLLSTTLPIGGRWVNWRTDFDGLRSLLAQPVEGVLYDVLHNGFWLAAWGERPVDPDAAQVAAEGHLALIPTLVPVYAHRFLPAAPAPARSPVFSVHQSDVIHYGTDLLDYVHREFGGAAVASGPRHAAPHIPFWSDLANGAQPRAN